MRRCAWLSMLGCLVLAAPALAAEVTVLTARQIHTADPARPTVSAISWDDEGRILAVGDAAGLLARHPRAVRIDLGEATVVPGLIDAHGHIMHLAHALMRADLVGARDKTEVIARLRDFERSLPAGAWLLGGGWDQNDWPGQAYPTAADLDAAFPDRPVWLSRVDGHASWGNSRAMAAAGRDLGGDWQPPGGRILRDHEGRATGIFVDEAVRLIDAQVPLPTAAEREQALQRALETVARNGLTGVHDMGTSQADLELFQRFADDGRLSLRIQAYADGDSEAMAQRCAQGPYRHAGGRLRMAGVKLYIDGALGSRGAALLADYSDEPGNRGLLVTAPDAFEAQVRKARGCRLQVASHAIGDRGNRLVLDTYARVLGDAADHRWRVEHAQVVDPVDIPRFAELGLVASMQPTHATSDMPWAGDRLGPERLAGAYAWQRFLQAGVALALGSDFPVESVDPRLGLHAATTRQDRAGEPAAGWLPAQRLGAAEALHGFTRGAAFAVHDEDEVGTLAPGLRADFVVLDRDPLAAPSGSLDDLEVRSTWLDGRPVYEAD